MLVQQARYPTTVQAPRPTREREAPGEPRDAYVPGETVEVGHRRELRGAWVASVWNINFPSTPKVPEVIQKFELRNMLDRLKECGFNAVFFQVRPEGDALYRSELEPWSAWLTNRQGRDPGYDPLQYLIEQAHERNIEVHAWMNPYRAQSGNQARVAPHIAVTHPEHVHPYGAVKWMDPGAQPVRGRLVDVCRDVTKRYDVDGIHFDDYFYPYPLEGVPFPDQATYQAYRDGGGTLGLADWRRENVNSAVREVNDAVRGEKDYVRFGISPFGLPAPDRPEGISGFDQYEGLYADTQKWMNEGWVDYLAPQLYWPTTQPRQPYEPLLNWWAEHTQGGRYIFAGNDLSSLGKNAKWTVDEFKKQVAITRAQHDNGAQGNIWYNVGPLLENRRGIVSAFKDHLYGEPALTPPLSRFKGQAVAAPEARVEGRQVSMTHRDGVPLRAWTVYRPKADGWELDRIIPGDQSTFELPAGRWAIAAANKHGNESQGVVVDFS